MSEQRWAEVRRVLEAALDLTSEERSAFVEESCAGDEELKQEVQRLLELEEGGIDSTRARQVDQDAFGTLLGRVGEFEFSGRIGSYRILEELGAGGMGRVFKAVQDTPRRTVAVKVMARGAKGSFSPRRFEFEAEIVARLNHPNIAQCYEAGTWRDESRPDHETPFLVIEYVEDARDLIEYADQEGLGTSERIELFNTICEAVHHGHQKGVIHRDLKPANLLVDRQGQPKVIDFGVARMVDRDSSIAASLTQTGQILGTLRYMSPEQLEPTRGDIDTRADVYSLGVVLYELLCGRMPCGDDATNMASLALAILEGEPTPPGSIVAELKGDLDLILLRCLEKDRDRRYASASELASDLRRHLAHEPVLATSPSASYRLRKFVRRNRTAVFSACVVFIGLVASVIVTGSLYFDALQANAAERAERQRADSESQRANRVKDYLLGSFRSLEGSKAGPKAQVREILEHAESELSSAFAGDPMGELEIRLMIAKGYDDLGEHARSEEHWRRYLAILRETVEQDDSRILTGEFHHAFSLFWLGRVDESLDLLESNLADKERILGPDALPTGMTLLRIGSILSMDRGRAQEAAEYLGRALDVLLPLLGEEDPDVLACQTAIASCWADQGRAEDALDLMARTHEVQVGVLGAGDAETLNSLSIMASMLADLQRFGEAAALSEDVYLAQREFHGSAHPLTLHARAALGSYLLYSDPAVAEEHLTPALEGCIELLGEEHPQTLMVMTTLAEALAIQGEFERAQPLIDRAIEGSRVTNGPDHYDTLATLESRARLRMALGRYDEAIQDLRDSLEGRIRVHGEGGYPVFGTLHQLAQHLHLLGDHGEALSFAERAVAIAEELLDPEGVDLAGCRLTLGSLLHALGRDGEALEPLTLAHEHLLANLGAEDHFTRRAALLLAALHEVEE